MLMFPYFLEVTLPKQPFLTEKSKAASYKDKV